MPWKFLDVRIVFFDSFTFRRKPSFQQTSPTSVAYTVLGGFVVGVGPYCALPVVESHLIAVKYNLISLIVKEKVRFY
jgi:hypothetical protein